MPIFGVIQFLCKNVLLPNVKILLNSTDVDIKVQKNYVSDKINTKNGTAWI